MTFPPPIFLNPNVLNSNVTATLAPVLQQLEAERDKQVARCQSAMLWCGVGGAIGMVVVGLALHSGILMFAPLVVALTVYACILGGAKKEYKTGFKLMVMPSLVASFGELTYSPQSGLSENEFNTANLYTRPDRFRSEDLIEGRIGETRLRFSEVHAEDEQTRTDSEGHTHTDYVTIFRGLFFIADFNKNFAGATYVLPEGVSGSLGKFGQGLQSLGGKMAGRGALVKLEDPEFEQQFIVYASDQTEARYILSSSLMRRLMELHHRFDGKVSAAFLGGSVYLMIASYQTWFEPPPLGTPLTIESLGPILAQLQLATGVVHDLDLNTRIWSKA